MSGRKCLPCSKGPVRFQERVEETKHRGSVWSRVPRMTKFFEVGEYSPALGTPFAQGHDYHLQEKKRHVDVLRLHEGLPPRLRFVHSFRPGEVDLCKFWLFVLRQGAFTMLSLCSGVRLRFPLQAGYWNTLLPRCSSPRLLVLHSYSHRTKLGTCSSLAKQGGEGRPQWHGPYLAVGGGTVLPYQM